MDRLKFNQPPKRKIKKAGSEDSEVCERKCLKCLKIFVSQWAGNRICDVCKKVWIITARNEVTEYAEIDVSQKPKSRPD